MTRPSPAGHAAPRRTGPSPSGRRRSGVRRAVLLVAVFVVVGALAGAAWELLWTPPRGVALEDRFVFTSSGLADSFGGTALYALVGVAAGLLLGAAAALRAPGGTELATLAAVAVGSVLAAVVMTVVGTALGPPDADEAARGQEDYTPVQQDLRVEGLAAYLAFPTGALLGAGGVFLSLSRRRRDAPADRADQTAAHRSGDDQGGAGAGPAPPR